MSKRKYNLICVAHPDDETIFFGGLIQRRRKYPWLIVCATDANADGQGRKRQRQFNKACNLLGVEETQWWGFPDIFEKRLPAEALVERLVSLHEPHEVFTHGPLGEYGHPHHQDLGYAVYKAFRGHPRLYSVAYNTYPELKVELTKEEYELKSRILTDVYGSETTRFLNLLPSTFTEGFSRLEEKEVEDLYRFVANGRSLHPKVLKAHGWLTKFLKSQSKKPKRPF